MLRHLADVKSLLWLVLTVLCVALQYLRPSWVVFLAPLSCYFALCCGVMAHNHNHCPTFRSRGLNRWFGNALSIFYGYPTFAWIPTHNQNHHKFVNRPGDATITWRYSEKHGIWVALTYFFVSSYWQSEPIKSFIARARRNNPRMYRDIVAQYVLWAGAHVGLCALAVLLHGWRQGLMLWGCACLIPALFALWTIMLFNYEQHVHADPWSKHNHSRSWEGRWLNFLLFNNGLHAAHHEAPGTHWSELWAVHRRIVPHIDSRLVERGGFMAYVFRQYVLAAFVPKLATVQVGRAPNDVPDGCSEDLASPPSELGECGSNATMLGSRPRTASDLS
ncbi:MAG: fatty acid desaturase [Myxococcales bacterium FL481]|nr:MAG: fatty acid desaturase [Myxococcales bacterium FL481]